MKKLLIAAFSILAASFVSSNSFAFPASHAKGIDGGASAVQVHYRHYRHYRHGRQLTLSHYGLCHYPYPTSATYGCYTLWPF
jgi:hypothetical protein